MLGNLAISVICGTVYGVTAVILGLPYPLALAVIAGILDLIPSIGATIAGIIVALVALSVSLQALIVFVIVIVVYQQIENYILQPTIIGKAAQVSGFTVLVSVLAFGALFGFIGAIIGVPIAAAIQIVVEELTAARRARIAAADRAGRASAPPERSRLAPPADRCDRRARGPAVEVSDGETTGGQAEGDAPRLLTDPRCSRGDRSLLTARSAGFDVLGLQARYGEIPGNGAFSMDPIRRRLVRLTPGRADCGLRGTARRGRPTWPPGRAGYEPLRESEANTHGHEVLGDPWVLSVKKPVFKRASGGLGRGFVADSSCG